MKPIKHAIKHHYQPTNNTCGYAALATLLSHYGENLTPEELVKKVEQPKDAEGNPQGSVTAQLATWCQSNGYQVKMYVADMYILDLSWKGKSTQQIAESLKRVKSKRSNQLIDSHWVSVYEDAYLSMIGKGGELSVVQFITTDLINSQLKKGPVYANICSSAHTGKGRTKSTGLRKDRINDTDGSISNHGIVIYGIDNDGNYLISDPWDGLTSCTPEHLVLSIEAAQIECDNQILVVSK